MENFHEEEYFICIFCDQKNAEKLKNINETLFKCKSCQKIYCSLCEREMIEEYLNTHSEGCHLKIDELEINNG